MCTEVGLYRGFREREFKSASEPASEPYHAVGNNEERIWT